MDNHEKSENEVAVHRLAWVLAHSNVDLCFQMESLGILAEKGLHKPDIAQQILRKVTEDHPELILSEVFAEAVTNVVKHGRTVRYERNHQQDIIFLSLPSHQPQRR